MGSGGQPNVGIVGGEAWGPTREILTQTAIEHAGSNLQEQVRGFW
jgi:hypothetical protein